MSSEALDLQQVLRETSRPFPMRGIQELAMKKHNINLERVERIYNEIKELSSSIDRELIEDFVMLMKSPEDLILKSEVLERLVKATEEISKRYAELEDELQELSVADYLELWRKYYYELLDVYMKNKSKFYNLLKERNGHNTMMEQYYQLYMKFLSKCAEIVKQIQQGHEIKRLSHEPYATAYKIRDNKGIRNGITALNILVIYFGFPILAYMKGRQDYFEEAAFRSVLLLPFVGEPMPSKYEDLYAKMVGLA